MALQSALGFWRASTVPLLLVIAVAIGMLGACASPTSSAAVGPIVDGFPVGNPVACATASHSCDDLIGLARSALDQRDSGHLSIVQSSVYDEDLQNPALFDLSIPHARTGRVFVIVFDLADGSRKAAGVYCGVGECIPRTAYPH